MPVKQTTREQAQKYIIEEIARTWKKYPELRFGQLLINLGIAQDGPFWHVYDEEIASHLKKRECLK